MTDYTLSAAPTSHGVTVTERTGAAAGTDTIPAGALLLIRNTGAASHVVTLVNSRLDDTDLVIGNRAVTVATSSPSAVRVPLSYGDANGKVGIGVDGTPTEVKFYVLGA